MEGQRLIIQTTRLIRVCTVEYSYMRYTIIYESSVESRERRRARNTVVSPRRLRQIERSRRRTRMGTRLSNSVESSRPKETSSTALDRAGSVSSLCMYSFDRREALCGEI